jgi:hypothetical protein
MLLSAPVAFIGPDALDRMGRSSRTARSAMAGQRWCAAPMATVGQRWCAARFASTDGGTPDLRGSDWLSGPNGLKSGFRGVQATYPAGGPVAAVFWLNAARLARVSADEKAAGHADGRDVVIDDHVKAARPSQAFSPAAFVGLSIARTSASRRSSSRMIWTMRSALRCLAGMNRWGFHGARSCWG